MNIARHAAIVLVLAFAQASAHAAIARGETERGEAWLVGGIGEDEVAALRLARSGYTLSVQTAARGSGEWLADVHVRIADAQDRPVFEQDLAGPWLLIALQPGRYTVRATRGSDVQEAVVTVTAGTTHERVFHFEVTEPLPEDPVRFPPAAR